MSKDNEELFLTSLMEMVYYILHYELIPKLKNYFFES